VVWEDAMGLRACGSVAALLVMWGCLGPLQLAPACAHAARPRGHPPPPTTLADDGPTLTAILERHVDAVGGEDAIASMVSWVVQAHLVTNLPTWAPPVHEVDTLTVYAEISGRYRIVQRTSRGTVLEGCDGTTAWKRDVDGKVVDVGAKGARDAWLVDPRFPIRLCEHFPDMVYLGTATLAGRLVHAVEIDDDHSHRLYFDQAAGLLARLGFNTTILRYGEVDGVKVPFEVEYSRKGGASVLVIESVVLNVPIDERLFSPPRGH
jgi:hypothetical protein